MSFLIISDPTKRDAMVKEYLELKKNIRDNLLSERTGELELQADLSKFYKPITETQKATTREITGLKPIREGIEKLPEAITFPTTQPTEEEEEEDEEEEEEEEEIIGKIAYKFLNRPNPDKNFGVRKKKGHHYIGDKHVIIDNNDIIIKEDGTKFIGTPGLWELITSKKPERPSFNDDDYLEYDILMRKTNSIYSNNDPTQNRAKGNHRGKKWEDILSPIWDREKQIKYQYDIGRRVIQPPSQGDKPYQFIQPPSQGDKPYQFIQPPYKVYQPPSQGYGYKGEGVVVIPSDPNALLERLDLLLASQDAGHTGVGNELVSICGELKRQGVLDTKTYKKINSIIKK